MKPAELRGMTDEELRRRLEELRNEVRDLRFAAALGQLKDTAAIRKARKDIARILTILTERERARLAEQGLLPRRSSRGGNGSVGSSSSYKGERGDDGWRSSVGNHRGKYRSRDRNDGLRRLGVSSRIKWIRQWWWRLTIGGATHCTRRRSAEPVSFMRTTSTTCAESAISC